MEPGALACWPVGEGTQTQIQSAVIHYERKSNTSQIWLSLCLHIADKQIRETYLSLAHNGGDM